MSNPVEYVGLLGPLITVGGQHREAPYVEHDPQLTGKFTFEAMVYVQPPIAGPVQSLIELAGKLVNDPSARDMLLSEVWAQYEGVGVIPAGTKHAGNATRTTGRPLQGDRIKLSLERVTPAAAALYLGSFASRLAELANALGDDLEHPRVRLR